MSKLSVKDAAFTLGRHDILTEQRLAPRTKLLFPVHDGLNGGNCYVFLKVPRQIVEVEQATRTRYSSGPKLDIPQAVQQILDAVVEQGC